MEKKISYVWYILPLLAIVGILLYFLYFIQKPNPLRDAVIIDAVKLISDYREDAYGANSFYTRAYSFTDKRIIVTGKIKDIRKESLRHQGFTNQFEITIVLYGESLASVTDPHARKSQEQETEKQKLYRRARNIRENYFTDEVICSFHRSETYSLRNLKKDDTIAIQGYVVDNGLRDFYFGESFRKYYQNSRNYTPLFSWLDDIDDIKEGLTYTELDNLGLTTKTLSLPLYSCTLVSHLSIK